MDFAMVKHPAIDINTVLGSPSTAPIGLVIEISSVFPSAISRSIMGPVLDIECSSWMSE